LAPAGFGSTSEALATSGLVLRETPGTNGTHRAPRRQLVIYLSGLTEVECGDGAKRQFRPGDMLLADDTTGEGHITRDLAEPRRTVQVGLPEALDVTRWRLP
jgi:hypothetical protein